MFHGSWKKDAMQLAHLSIPTRTARAVLPRISPLQGVQKGSTTGAFYNVIYRLTETEKQDNAKLGPKRSRRKYLKIILKARTREKKSEGE